MSLRLTTEILYEILAKIIPWILRWNFFCEIYLFTCSKQTVYINSDSSKLNSEHNHRDEQEHENSTEKSSWIVIRRFPNVVLLWIPNPAIQGKIDDKCLAVKQELEICKWVKCYATLEILEWKQAHEQRGNGWQATTIRPRKKNMEYARNKDKISTPSNGSCAHHYQRYSVSNFMANSKWHERNWIVSIERKRVCVNETFEMLFHCRALDKGKSGRNLSS